MSQNPILRDLRETLACDPSYVKSAAEYIDTAFHDMGGTAQEAHAEWTPEHCHHAMKVARRWDALRQKGSQK